ncbi:hypothetical protein BpHYR1_025619 [Brachionus plicatilis]|uniref:Uncharacterized protein n=1 Tax=Brachionus plicatilis TaxID=10195 RepID=A0A3M7SUH9_BRAPC|nr:hypothetical protein BpHYR1_025619 [Brachionus plicatilis]
MYADRSTRPKFTCLGQGVLVKRVPSVDQIKVMSELGCTFVINFIFANISRIRLIKLRSQDTSKICDLTLEKENSFRKIHYKFFILNLAYCVQKIRVKKVQQSLLHYVAVSATQCRKNCLNH